MFWVSKLIIDEVVVLPGLIGTFGFYAAYAFILVSACAGGTTLGTLTFLVASFMRSSDVIGRLLSGASGIYEQCLYFLHCLDKESVGLRWNRSS